MKIAVTSQNKREVTEHAGRCRNFFIYEIVDGSISQKTLLELSKEQSFHESHGDQAHPLDDIQLFIAGSMGMGLINRLKAKGIECVITQEKEPDKVVAAYLDGSIDKLSSPQHQPHKHEGCGCHS
jgi:predicted Fe-Mo cluster-binding NifX family protein